MKKLAVVVTIAAMAAQNVQSATHEKVQLWDGGPYWATTNIGADKPEDYGLYFWWGDTTGHRPSLDGTFSFNFSGDNPAIYTYGKSVSELQNAGWVTSDGVLAPAHDAAHVQWGGGWRMPTYQELYDLCYNKCDWTWTTMNNIGGYVVRGRGAYASRNIFLPAAGYADNAWLCFGWGFCWSSFPWTTDTHAGVLCFNIDYHTTGRDYRHRCTGMSVRPVQGFDGNAIFALVLAPDSADWSSGSITLRCEDSDTSGAVHEYTLEYKNASGVWEEVDGAKNKLATKGQDANGQEVWIAKLTDTTFSSRLGGLPPVEYRVKDENRRVSEGCVTRTKYGIFVSPGGYAPEMNLKAYPSANPNYAETFGRLASSLGSFAKVHVLTGINAIYGKLNDAFVEVANTIKPGDICFLYFGTHGGLHQNSTSSVLALYNGYYEESQLANHIKLLNGVDAMHPNGNGVAIVGFVHACHSKAISDNAADQYCRVGSWCVNSVLTAPDSAWITATDSPKALSQGDYFSLFLLDYGWENGWAADSDGQLSCKDLADYTKARTDAIFDGLMMKDTGVSFKVEVGIVGASSLLCNIIIGRCGSHDSMSPPTNPEGMAAQGISENVIRIHASNLQRADRTIMFKRRGENATWESGYWKNWVGSFLYDDSDVASSGRERPYYYQIRTMNGAGVGRSDIRSAWRIHTGGMTQNWLDAHQTFVTASNGDILIASEMSAANGCRTVGECYALGIDPEDPDDDLKIAEFKMKDGKPEITLNHTKDGSGNSFEDRVKILGKAELTDAEWQEVPPEGNPAHRFFKVGVEMP